MDRRGASSCLNPTEKLSVQHWLRHGRMRSIAVGIMSTADEVSVKSVKRLCMRTWIGFGAENCTVCTTFSLVSAAFCDNEKPDRCSCSKCLRSSNETHQEVLRARGIAKDASSRFLFSFLYRPTNNLSYALYHQPFMNKMWLPLPAESGRPNFCALSSSCISSNTPPRSSRARPHLWLQQIE
ncbi:unnamed protein product [Albugo candida]|uniref:Uncharacterized protein n=1 Tax=Albugo candida TaxID=65357 RepID=A0A024GUG5_9STRA|nr:unnamed protein product [Albugo candida]|eukprot:CCI50379.1 unnamed protein product [Albugo candida]